MAETAACALPVPEPPPPSRPATFREVFGDREFCATWLAEFCSITGDQLARVALTVIVYERTRSPLLTALTYAVSYLPWVAGSLLLSDLADRFPRRTVMIGADLIRMALVAVMALPRMPLGAMLALLFAVTTLNAPFQGARSALRAAIMPGDRYTLGLAVVRVTRETGVVAGFVAGGLVVSLLHAQAALLIDAATFAVSALLLWAGVRHYPAPQRRRVTRLAEMSAGLRLVFSTRRLRTLMLLGWLGAFYTVAEALAVPYAAQLGHGTVAAGLIFAAGPMGSAVGMMIFSRLVSPARRIRWMGPLAVAACLVPLACLARPGLPALLAILAVSGLASGYQVTANASFVLAAPDSRRGQAYAIANGGMMISQGLVYVCAGAAASLAAPAPAIVIAGSGALGAACAVWLAAAWRNKSAVAPERG